ncbi:ATP-binding protein [bacterium]|nr:ATP-binding protein [bacterium]
MISSIRIQGFKSIVDQTLDLGLFNVLIGANGSGKTNILEAIGVFSAAAYGSVERESLRYRGVRPGEPALYKSSFTGKRFPPFIKLEAESSESAYYMATLNNPISSPEAKWGYSHEELKEVDRRIMTRAPGKSKLHVGNPLAIILSGIEQDLRQINRYKGLAAFSLFSEEETRRARKLIELLENYAIYTPVTDVLRDLSTDRMPKYPVGLSGRGLAKAVGDILNVRKKKIGGIDLDELMEFIEWADAISVIHPSGMTTGTTSPPLSPLLQFKDKFMRKGRHILSDLDVSEGVLYVLFIIVLLCHPDAPKFLSIDNFDQTMHPRLSKAITTFVTDELIERNDKQFIVTTHSPLVLDGLDISDDRIRLFAVDRNDYGATDISRIQLNAKALDLVRDGKWSLSRLWSEGRLGGVPKLI